MKKLFLSIGVLLLGLVLIACEPSATDEVLVLNSITIDNDTDELEYVEGGTTLKLVVTTDPENFDVTFTYAIIPQVNGISVNSEGVVTIGENVLPGTEFTVRVNAGSKTTTKKFVYGFDDSEPDESGIAFRYVKGDDSIVIRVPNENVPITGVSIISNDSDENKNLNNTEYETLGSKIVIKKEYLNSIKGGEKTISLHSSQDDFLVHVSIYDQRIYTVEELAAINDDNDSRAKAYLLANNLDLSEYLQPGSPGYNNGEGWKPIGSISTSDRGLMFNGIFDGDGYIITNVYMNAVGGDKGFFGAIGTNGEVKNLGLVNGYFTASGNFSGVFAGFVYGKITNSYVENVTIRGSRVNGFMGKDDNATSGIINNYSVVNPIGPIGGLFGEYSKTTFTNNFAREYMDTDFFYDMSRNGDWSTSGPKTDLEMKQANTFSHLDENLFVVEDGKYPHFVKSNTYGLVTDLEIMAHSEFVARSFYIPVKLTGGNSYNQVTFESDNPEFAVTNGYVEFDHRSIVDGTTFTITVKHGEIEKSQLFTVKVPVSSMSITNDSDHILFNDADETNLEITYKVSPAEADQNVTFSLVEEIAGVSINEEGILTILPSVLEGTLIEVKITHDTEVSATKVFTYGYASVESVTINNHLSEVGHGSFNILTTVRPWNAQQTLVYSIVEDIVGISINEEGLVTITNEVLDETTFTVKVEAVGGLSETKEFVVLVPVLDLVLNNPSLEIERAGVVTTFQLDVTTVPASANQSLTYEVEDIAGITVSSTGLISIDDSVLANTQFSVTVRAESGIFKQYELVFDGELSLIEITNNVVLYEKASLDNILLNVESTNASVLSVEDLELDVDYELTLEGITLLSNYLDNLLVGEHILTVKTSLRDIKVGIKVADKIIRDKEDFYNIETFGVDKYYVMANDILFDGDQINEMYVVNEFSGTLDGNGFRIDDFTVKAARTSIIYVLEAEGVVKNISVGGVFNTTTNYSASIVRTNNGLIENVFVDADIIGTASNGGVTNSNYGTIRKTVFAGLITVSEVKRIGYVTATNRPGSTMVDTFAIVHPNTSSAIINSELAEVGGLAGKNEGSIIDSRILSMEEYTTPATYSNFSHDVWELVNSEAPKLRHNAFDFSQ